MLPAVFSSLTTTAVAFSLFFFVDGTVGDFFSDVSFVVVATLMVAMVESFFFLPAHIAHSNALTPDSKQTKIEKIFNNSMTWFRDHIYEPFLKIATRRLGLMVVIALVSLAGAFALVGTGTVSVVFFPNVDQDVTYATLELPPGTNEDITLSKLQEIEAAIWRVNEQYSKDREDSLQVVQKVELIMGPDSHEGYLNIVLLGGETRGISSFEISKTIREEAPKIPDARSLAFGSPPALFGKPISVALVGRDLETLRAAKNELKATLEKRDDLRDVTDTDEQGTTELQVKLKPKAELLGLSLSGVLQQVRSGFFGLEAQSVQRGDEEVKIWLRYGEEDKTSVAALRDMRIRTASGAEYPLRDLADLEEGEGVIAINHQDGRREMRVEADVANLEVPVPSVLAEIDEKVLPEIFEKYPGISRTYEGQSRESTKAQGSVRTAGPIILIIMIALILFNFKSYSQTLITLLLIPFTLIGVAVGHWIHGLPLSIFSGVGMIALIGVLINNTLVFVSTFNDRLIEGDEIMPALRETAISRFRPIVMTTITTVAGLAPLIAGQSLGAQFLKPTAVAVAYGLVFATFLTLCLLPSLLIISNRTKMLWYRLWNGERTAPEQLEAPVKQLKHQS